MVKTSSGRLKATDSIQRSGTIVMKARRTLTRKRTIRAGLSAARPSKPVVAVVSAASAIDEASSTRNQEEEGGHRHQDDDQHRGHRSGVAEIVILEGLLVNVVDRELGR